MILLAKANTLIGIDPGIQTGVANYDRKTRKFAELLTLTFWKTIEYVQSFSPSNVELVIENAMLNQFSYARHTQVGKEALRIARNAGANCREAELLINGLTRDGYIVHEIKPTNRKWTAEQFNKITGHAGPTNQHVRDACALVYGL
jgi:hypothetical protein